MPGFFTNCVPAISLYACFVEKKQFEFPSECLDTAVLFFCEKGHFRFSIDSGEPECAESGDVVFCPAKSTLHREVVTPVTLHVLHFSLHETACKQYPCGKLHLANPERILTDFNTLPNSVILHNFHPYELHFLLDVWYTVAIQLDANTHAQNKNADLWMEKARTKLMQNLSQKITLTELATTFGLTPVAFVRRFSKAYGQTPIHFLTTIRMKKAVQLLNETAKTVKEISEICGYENAYYFSNCFKKYTGLSPRAFRNALRL